MPIRPPRAHAQGQPPKPRQQVSPRQLGYTTEWDKARAEFLKAHRFCECPLHKGTPDAPPSQMVDHIKPHKGDRTLFWSRSNWQAMTNSCHSTKTGRYDRPESRPLTNVKKLSGHPPGGGAVPFSRAPASFENSGAAPKPAVRDSAVGFV